jgi:hypothetical protein
MSIEMKDCPQCGANRIRTTVSICDTCEISNRYEERIDELEKALAKHEARWRLQTVRERLNLLAKAPPGWADGEGLTPAPAVVARAWDVIARLLADCPDIARPKLYPTPEGEVQAEWSTKRYAVEVLFRRTGTIEAVATDLAHVDADDDEESFAANAVDKDDAGRLAVWLRTFLGKADGGRTES